MYYDYYLYYFSYLSALFNGYPLIIRLTVVMVMVLAVIILFGLIQLIFVGYRTNRKDKRKKNVKSYFEEKLLFIMKNNSDYDTQEIQELLHYDVSKTRKWKPEDLTDIVLSVKDKVEKEGLLNESNYKNCLQALSIMGFWENRIKHSSLNKRREALQVVGKIDNGVSTGMLSKSTFHKNKDLRKTARDLYTGNDHNNPFKFMEENFDNSFTNLDKLRLHSTLIKRDKEVKLPNLLRWVSNSTNPNYIIFILKEVAFFKQHDAIPTLLTMLDKQIDKEVRVQVINTLGALEADEAVPFLINLFSLESRSVREAIIVAMGKIQTNNSLDFLVQTYGFTQDANAKLIIARAIKNHGSEGVSVLKSMQQNVHNEVQENVLLGQVISEKLALTV